MDDSQELPVQQVGYLGKAGEALVWFPFGFHANVSIGELVALFSMQGKAAARVAMPGSPLNRPKNLAVGEVVVYHPATGSKVHFKANGDVDVTSVGDVNVSAVNVAITGTTKVTLDAATIEAALGATLAAVDERIVAIFDSHQHIGGTAVRATDTIATKGPVTTTKLKVS